MRMCSARKGGGGGGGGVSGCGWVWVTGERPKRQLSPDASAKFSPVTVRVCPAVEARAWEGETDATICTHDSVSRQGGKHGWWIGPSEMFWGLEV